MIDPQAFTELYLRENTQKNQILSEYQKLILDNIIDGVVLFKEDRYIYVNQAFTEISGYGEEELLGKRWQDFYPAKDAQKIEKEILGICKENKYWRGETISYHKNGQKVWKQMSLSLIEDGILIGICRDISEGKKTQTMVKAQESAMRALYQVTSSSSLTFAEKLEGIFNLGRTFFDLEMGVLTRGLDTSIQIVKFQGEKRNGEVVQLPVYINNDQSLCFICLQKQEPLVIESLAKSIYKEHPGHTLWNIQSYIGAKIEVSGKTYGTLCFFSFEEKNSDTITENSQQLLKLMAQWIGYEIERQESQKLLEQKFQQEVLLKTIVQSIRQTIDYEELFQRAAETIGETFNLDRCHLFTYDTTKKPAMTPLGEYLSEGILSMSHVNVDPHNIRNLHLEKILEQDEAVVTNNVFEDPLLENMRHVCVQVDLKSMMAVRTSYLGQANGIICLHTCKEYRNWTDSEIELIENVASQFGIAIAQAKLLQQEKEQKEQLELKNKALEEARKEAESANRAKSAFLATMSHEIRTPMNGIMGMADLLCHTPLNKEQKDYVKTINQSGSLLLTIINDILDLAKIEAGKIELEKKPFNLHQCIEEVLKLMRANAINKNIKLIYIKNHLIPADFIGDINRLKQIILNLVSNGIKFTEKGEVQVKADARLCPDGFHVIQIAIKDTGIGIPTDKCDRLFKPFSQVDGTNTRKYGGTGLGLVISQKIAHLMGGKITFKTEIAQGSTFYITIKLLALSSEEISERNLLNSNENIENKTLKISSLPIKILLVEDNPVNYKVARLMFQKLGYTGEKLNIAHDGLQALELINQNQYDIVFMDLQMPNLDGLNTTIKIRALGKKIKQPWIVAMTASALAEDRKNCFNVGMNDYVSKPIRSGTIQQALQRFSNSLIL
ncbi:multi-sensor hybrid histidine kinase [Cyanobacterium stanieri PCC 7202]|uniref:Circadian input-output histidine kinase CikA n=1 Tax=Cyanobacterium stanieri (strain ATCC 29140 / PCC 7202) TaxID=292563 RepID=K9YI44_CYASC|nr:multi-sensor hybrid histidine kinase [Cyanobacterium stanieri PCC 7202]